MTLYEIALKFLCAVWPCMQIKVFEVIRRVWFKEKEKSFDKVSKAITYRE
jgi:hypothetical protein